MVITANGVIFHIGASGVIVTMRFATTAAIIATIGPTMVATTRAAATRSTATMAILILRTAETTTAGRSLLSVSASSEGRTLG